MVYSLAEKVEIIFLYGKQNECARETARIFNELHPDHQTSHTYVSQIVKKFRETGSVANLKKNNPPNELMEVGILGELTMNPHQSVRSLERTTGIPKSNVHRILQKHKWHPYKIHLVHCLNEDDPDRRIEFCDIIFWGWVTPSLRG
ncbi:hypothetical protein ABEB36_000218 [Hypothenemus hampei]|uniref:DUF4817 domain-containing protein n=1 Tax=Hypothenemus hampei TaxID=57062 RepID=A0ABD1FAJ4_HYPHA